MRSSGPAGLPPLDRPTLPWSTVPLQGSAVAKRCPVRAQLDATVPSPGSPVPDSEAAQVRATEAQAFTTRICAEFLAAHPPGSAVDLSATAAEDRLDATRAAVAAGAALIVRPVLPVDLEHRRQGGPDLLIRVGDPATSGGYVPIEIKHHSLARLDRTPGGTAHWSPLDHPDPRHQRVQDQVDLGRRYQHDDGFQLAHSWRLLEAAGWAPDPRLVTAVGGIVDKHARIWWLDLAEATWPRWWRDDTVSLLQCYDDEFAWRLDIIANQHLRNTQPDRAPLVQPSRISECDSCPWRGVCLPALEAADDVSLLPRTTWRNSVLQRTHGVHTRADVARLDWTTAWVAQGRTGHEPAFELADYPATDLARPGGLDEAPPELVERLTELADPAETPAQVRDRLDARTAALAVRNGGHLPTLIDQARARVSGRPFRARGVARIDAHRADIEIDLDMENMPEGVYLWGTLTTTAADLDHQWCPPGYRPFVTWADDQGGTGTVTPAAEQALLATVVHWLHQVVAEATGRNRTVAIYCWSRAEEIVLRRILRDVDDPAFPRAEAEALVASPHWVDLLPVFSSQVVTGGGNGLKVVAPLAGFTWRDADPGGEQSQAWYRRAVTDPDPAVRATFRQRVLAYNEDDVWATRAVREWLAGPGQDLPSIDDWAPPD